MDIIEELIERLVFLAERLGTDPGILEWYKESLIDPRVSEDQIHLALDKLVADYPPDPV